jgi:hypothetical protein
MTRRQNFRAARAAVIAIVFLSSAHALARQGGRTRQRHSRNLAAAGRRPTLTPRRISLSGGRTFELSLPDFIKAGVVYGRPADIFAFGRDAFLLTDDRAGVVYYIYKK